ncbi:hypothetical protein NC652_040663 [Populus alba x Populus x berolinensis]|nr:hypothetical protein NC652_040663 [Populus alba x Populus x berolinensis]
MLAYAVGRLLLPFPTPKRMFIAAKLILVCWIRHHLPYTKGRRN